MDRVDFEARTKRFALDVMALVGRLPNGRIPDVLSRQLLRSATSVGANYRAACRARSPKEMFAKLCIVEEEADECLYWFELLRDGRIVPQEAVQQLWIECDQLLAMTVKSKKTLRARLTGAGAEF